jgi:hypothetical protein
MKQIEQPIILQKRVIINVNKILGMRFIDQNLLMALLTLKEFVEGFPIPSFLSSNDSIETALNKISKYYKVSTVQLKKYFMVR